jgi:hypothetical protein
MEETLQMLLASQTPGRDIVYVREAIEIGKRAKLFADGKETWQGSSPEVHKVLGKDLQNLDRWKLALATNTHREVPTQHTLEVGTAGTSRHAGGSVTWDNQRHTRGRRLKENPEEMTEVALTVVDPSCLLPAQHWAYNIITWHVKATLADENPP